MASFRILLIGSSEPLFLDLPASNVDALCELMRHERYVTGHMTTPDHEGVCPGVLLPACRIQLVTEIS